MIRIRTMQIGTDLSNVSTCPTRDAKLLLNFALAYVELLLQFGNLSAALLQLIIGLLVDVAEFLAQGCTDILFSCELFFGLFQFLLACN